MRSTIVALLGMFVLGSCAGAEVTRLESEVQALTQRVNTVENRLERIEKAKGGKARGPSKGKAKGKGKSKGKTKGKTKQPGKAKTKQPGGGGGAAPQ